MIKGSCACGRIQYSTDAQPLSINVCHCGTCQRISGSAFLAFVDFQTSQVTWTQQPDKWSCSDIAGRGYCKMCGSTMSMIYHFEKEQTYICLGTVVETDHSLQPGAHIFLKDKAPWFTIADDGARRRDTFSLEFEEKIKKWKAEQTHG
ncbi:Mss4-like protein [Exophiala viscosa]|uniref:Mss4-like protein n=1 Tax=Exophiala viscosa TaxID=2486360 RepID=UPI00219E36C0|nr:Mss4-like protein [Exophiala viscosa]